MSVNKETANYGKLEVQLMSCMKEIKYEGTDRETDYNISKFAQILVGDEYIKKHRKEHREKEWKIFCQPYVQRVLEEYASDEAHKLLFAVNGFLEEYRDLGIEQRRKKYADANGCVSKTVWNREDKIIEEVVKKLLNEIQENDRHELRLLADEVFAELGSAKPDDEVDGYEPKPFTNNEPTPMPNRLEDTEGSLEKQEKTFSGQTQTIKRLQRRQNIVIAVVIVLVIGTVGDYLHNYFNGRSPEDREMVEPLIESLSVTTPEICLYPGKETLIQLDIVPNEADINSVNCIPDDPGVATVNHRMVTAQTEWQEENHETTITVQGGVAPPGYVHVTVLPDPEGQFTGANKPDGKNVEKEGGQ